MPKELTAINLRHNLGAVLDQVANGPERFLIKRAGIPAAVLISIADYEDAEDLRDTWHEQRDPVFQRSLVKGRQDIKRGKVATLKDLQRDLQLKERQEKTRRRT
jgi:prevent-host-death family protein